MNVDLGNSRQIRKRTIVELKCVFVKIRNIDTVHENYFADVFIQAKWKEPLMNNKSNSKVDISKYWNPKLFIDNAYGDLKEIISTEVKYSGAKQETFVFEKRRVKGIFREILELKQFPFDCQDLSVIVSSELSHEDIEFTHSLTDISKLNITSVLDSQEWDLHSHVDVALKDVMSVCDIGPKIRQTITFTCRASRRFRYFLINHLMISAMLSFLAFCSFAITPSNTFGRLQLCMINLLTTVTFKVVVSQNLPKISYLTYLDKAVLGNICVIMSLCLWHALTSLFFNGNIIKTSNSTTVSMPLMIEDVQSIENVLIPCILGIYLLAISFYATIIFFDAGSRRREMRRKDIEFIKKLNARHCSSNA